MLSRATILALAANKEHKSANASTLASIGEMASSELESAFQIYCQALTCLQVDFWALEAAGLVKIDDRMVKQTCSTSANAAKLTLIIYRCYNTSLLQMR